MKIDNHLFRIHAVVPTYIAWCNKKVELFERIIRRFVKSPLHGVGKLKDGKNLRHNEKAAIVLTIQRYLYFFEVFFLFLILHAGLVN